MNRIKKISFSSQPFVLLLLALFVSMSTALVIMGTLAFRTVSNNADTHGLDRVMTAFTRSAVFADDASGVCRFSNENGTDVFVIESDIDGETYRHNLYVVNGMLMESFTSAERAFSPEEGETLCEASMLAAEVKPDSVVLTIEGEEGNTRSFTVALKAAE